MLPFCNRHEVHGFDIIPTFGRVCQMPCSDVLWSVHCDSNSIMVLQLFGFLGSATCNLLAGTTTRTSSAEAQRTQHCQDKVL